MYKLCIILLCVLIHHGIAFECYECASENNVGCADPVQKASIPTKNCNNWHPNQTNYFCVSYVKTGNLDNTNYTFRECTIDKGFCAHLNQEEQRKENYKVGYCELCAEDKCNASDNLTSYILTVFSVFILQFSLSFII